MAVPPDEEFDWLVGVSGSQFYKIPLPGFGQTHFSLEGALVNPGDVP
jgi:hypothetical protein